MSKSEKKLYAITSEVKSSQQILDQYRKVQKAQKGPQKMIMLAAIAPWISVGILVVYFSEVLGYSIIAVGLAAVAWVLSKPSNQDMAKRHATYLEMMVQQNEAVLFEIVISSDQWGLSHEEVLELIFSGNTEGMGHIELAWTSFMDLVWKNINLFDRNVYLSLYNHFLKHPWH